MWLNKRITTMELIYYVVGQIVGGLIASFALLSILKGAGKSIENLGQNGVGELSVAGALTVEIILTFIFVLVVMTVTSAKKGNAISRNRNWLTLNNDSLSRHSFDRNFCQPSS